MAGFDNEVVYGSNVDFSGSTTVTGQVTTNGQLLIGSTAAPNIRVATLTAGSGVSITNGAGSITIAVSGSSVGQTITGNIGGAISPVAGNWNILGSSVAAGTSPVQTSGSGNTLSVNVQIAQAVAAADATKIGLSNFNSAQFSVTPTGFVSIIAGGFVWNDITGATQTISVENGYVTDRGGGVTYTLPATASFGDEFIITGKSGLWTLAQNANQSIGISSSTSTVGITGSLVATNAGDSIWAVCTTAGASTVWRVYNYVGNITVN